MSPWFQEVLLDLVVCSFLVKAAKEIVDSLVFGLVGTELCACAVLEYDECSPRLLKK